MSELIPSPRAFLTSLLSELSAHQLASSSSATTATNPLTSVSSATKALFLTLHCIFPTEFLLALDLLDRGLVSRYSVTGHGDGLQMSSEPVPLQMEEGEGNSCVYYVRSSHPSMRSGGGPSRSRSSVLPASSSTAAASNTYEVRLTPWNCSCPAFAFSAFPPSTPPKQQENHPSTQPYPSFGGQLLDQENMPPTCKHLLACAIAEHCPALLGRYVAEEVVSVEEIAGRGAGW
ncbi:MAG: hypothetical protein M1813_003556 [Trichoglossum hirsutum]|nr:MAG: hypothetical protein M1813_003556 [Trichoglossum hirsutum]